MRTLVWLSLVLCTVPAWAVDGGRHWLNLDFTYTELTYKEPGLLTEKGRLAGVRGEFGFFLFSNLGVSAGGEYQDGNLDYEGPSATATIPMKEITNDYFRRTEILGHLALSGFVLSSGVAQRYWYNDLVTSYRRRTRYEYIPVYLTYRMQNFYIRYEQDIWKKGWNKRQVSDVNPAASDVEFNLGKGNGYGAELGIVIPGWVASRIFVAWHKWTVKESDVQNDGTQNLTEPDNNTTEIKGGLGFSF